MTTRDLVTGWGRWLINRPRPFALQQPDGSYRWVWEPCTRDHLARHLAGDLTLAVSSLDASGLCRWVCLDVDTADGLPHLITLRDQFAWLGFSGIVEASRRGGHLWLLFSGVVRADTARAAILGVLDRLRDQGVVIPRYELYPDTAAPRALGHAVRLPLGIHRRTGRRYPLLDQGGQPLQFSSVEGALSWFLAHLRTPVQWLKATWATPAPVMERATPLPSATRSTVVRWVDAQISPLDLLAELAPASALRPSGRGYIGWCPFHPDAAPQEDGTPGTPSLYVIQHRVYGWEWRCLSSHCRFHGFPMQHAFRLFCELQQLTVQEGIAAAQHRWPQASTTNERMIS